MCAVPVLFSVIRGIRGCSFLLAVPLFLCGSSFAQSPTYWQDVRPALRKHCIACHNVRNVKEVEVSGGLALDNFDAFMKGAKKPVVQSGKSADSELVKRILSKDDSLRMPPGDAKVPEEVVLLLRRWIDTGAAEGKKPEDAPAIITTTPPKRRKLPVSLLTSAIPAQGILDSGKPDKLALTLRIGPLAPVTAVAFSPDGKWLAAGTYGRVTLWDLKTGQPVKALTNVLGSVNDLRFSPDGTVMVVAGGQPSAQGDLRLFETGTWKVKTVLRGHDDVVSSVSFRPDGKKLVTASFDKTVRIWDMTTLKSEALLEPHTDYVYAVAYSADGKLLASASKDRTVKLLEGDSGKGLLTFGGMTQDVMAVAFNADGSRVVSSGYEANLFWWDTKSAAREKSVNAHRVSVNEIAVSADRKQFATAGGDGNVILWDAADGKSQKTLSAGSLVYSVALSGDARLVAAGCYDGFVRLYEVKSGRHLLSLLELAGTAGDADWLALTPEGYAMGSKTLLDTGEWHMAKRVVPGANVWKTLSKPESVGAALRGETLPAPAFQK